MSSPKAQHFSSHGAERAAARWEAITILASMVLRHARAAERQQACLNALILVHLVGHWVHLVATSFINYNSYQ